MDPERLSEAVVRWGSILVPRLIGGAIILLIMRGVYGFTGSREIAWALFGGIFLMMVGLEILIDSFGRSQKPPGGPPVARE